MSGARVYAFRPAALRGEVRYTLDGTLLTRAGGTPLDLATVSDGAWVNFAFRGSRMMRLDLVAPDGTHAIGYNASARDWQADPGARAFLELVRDSLDALAAARPGTDLSLGMRGGGRWAMFAIGVAAVLAGAGLGLAALGSGVPGERLAAAAVPVVTLGLMGALIAWSYRPTARPPRARAEAVARVIDGVLAGLPGA